MPWQEQSTMSLRHAFVLRASQPDANVRAVCRHYGISPTTGYTLLARFAADGVAGLVDRSRRPRASPVRTAPETEAAVHALRREHPTWGGRKLRARLLALGHAQVPSASTITAILRRHDALAAPNATPPARQRWERETPNALWQMDFKGHFPTAAARCHPLTVLDDHSRFALCLAACANEQTPTVQTHLTQLFRQCGLPAAVLCDNGPPWGSGGSEPAALAVWLMRLGVRVPHGAALPPADARQGGTLSPHPQTRTAYRTGVRRSCRQPTRLRPPAQRLQHYPSPRSPCRCGACQPLPPQPRPLSRSPAPPRLCRRHRDPIGTRRRPGAVPPAPLPGRQRLRWLPRGLVPHRHRRRVGRLLRHPACRLH